MNTSKSKYISPVATKIVSFTEEAILNMSSTRLSDETNDADAVQWSNQRQQNDGGMWQYMDKD